MSQVATPVAPAQPKMDLPVKVRVAYVFNSIAGAFAMVIPMGYLTLYMQNYLGISPALVATLNAVAGIINLPFGLIAPSIVQKSNSKIGQYRFWFIGCGMASFIGTVLCFIPTINTPGKVALVALGFIVARIPTNFSMAANNGLMMKICGPNLGNRLGLSALNMQATNAINIVTSFSTPLLALYFNNLWLGRVDGNIADVGNGYRFLAIIYGIFAVAGVFVLFSVSKPYDVHDPHRKLNTMTNVSFLEMYKGYITNKTLVWFAIRDIISAMGMVGMGLAIYYFIYAATKTPGYENLRYQSIANTITTAAGLFGAFAMPPLGRKIGMKRTSLIVSGFLCVTALFNAVFAYQRLWVYVVCNAVASIVMMASMSFGFNMYLNPAEEQLYKTGKDVRVAAMTLAMLPMSIGMLLATPITPIIYRFIGFDQTVYPPVVANPELLVRLMFLIPIPTTLISILITLFAYRIKDSEAQFYMQENQKRIMEQMMKAAQQANASEGGPST
jgi:Na+/melibiose symporter-like transporter